MSGGSLTLLLLAFWTLSAAVIIAVRWRRKQKPTSTEVAFGISLVGVSLFSWLVNYIAYNEIVYDPPYFVEVFNELLPAWYDRLVELILPNVLIGISVSCFFGIKSPGIFLRLSLFLLVGFDWCRMAWSLPWDVYHQRWAAASHQRLGFNDLSPILDLSLSLSIPIAIIYAILVWLEHLKAVREHAAGHPQETPESKFNG